MPALLTTEQVAERLAVDPRTVRRWALDKVLPAIDLGSVYRFEPEAIEAWLEERRSGGTKLGGHPSAAGVAGEKKKATAPTVTSRKEKQL